MYNIFCNRMIRKLILSYCPKNIIKCITCKDLCMINNKVTKRFTEIPTKDYTVIYYQCLLCNWRSNTIDIIN